MSDFENIPRMNGAETTELLNLRHRNEYLTNRLNALQKIADVWYFEVNGEVSVSTDPAEPGACLNATFKKPGGAGFQKSFGPNVLEYFKSSPEGIIDELTEEIYLKFYKNIIKRRVESLVIRGIDNANKIGNKV